MKKFSIKTILASWIFLMFFWWLISLLVGMSILPSPWEVFPKISVIFFDVIIEHLWWSFFRIITGIFLAIAIAYPLGMLMGYYNFFDKVISPIAYLLYPIPKIALLPIIMLFLGLGEMSKITIIFLIIFFQILVSIRDAVKSIPKEYYHIFYTLGATYGEIARYILVPASLPPLFSSIKTALATAISVLFFTETYGTDAGLGYFIMDAWLRVDYVEMYSGILILGMLGMGLFFIIDKIQINVCKWQQIEF